MPDNKEIDRASSLRTLELKIAQIPDESLIYHATRNHFSNWLMARSEFALASTFREVQASEFQNTADLRQYIVSGLHTVRKLQQKGVVAQFRAQTFDSDIMDFVKIGDGSLGGKARGLAFMSALLRQDPALLIAYPQVSIQIPKTLVITTQGFESFIALNQLQYCAKNDFSDREISDVFSKAEMPDWLVIRPGGISGSGSLPFVHPVFQSSGRCPVSALCRVVSDLHDSEQSPGSGHTASAVDPCHQAGICLNLL